MAEVATLNTSGFAKSYDPTQNFCIGDMALDATNNLLYVGGQPFLTDNTILTILIIDTVTMTLVSDNTVTYPPISPGGQVQSIDMDATNVYVGFAANTGVNQVQALKMNIASVFTTVNSIIMGDGNTTAAVITIADPTHGYVYFYSTYDNTNQKAIIDKIRISDWTNQGSLTYQYDFASSPAPNYPWQAGVDFFNQLGFFPLNQWATNVNPFGSTVPLKLLKIDLAAMTLDSSATLTTYLGNEVWGITNVVVDAASDTGYLDANAYVGGGFTPTDTFAEFAMNDPPPAPPAQTVSPTGIATAEAFGNPVIMQDLIPVINSFVPFVGSSESTVRINGNNFTGITDVKFNGTSASSFTIVSDVLIAAIVPNIFTSGFIEVINPSFTTTTTIKFGKLLCGVGTY